MKKKLAVAAALIAAIVFGAVVVGPQVAEARDSGWGCGGACRGR